MKTYQTPQICMVIEEKCEQVETDNMMDVFSVLVDKYC